MPLITCPDCHKQLSDQATACPHCGYPITKNQPAVDKSPRNTAGNPAAHGGRDDPVMLLGFLLLIGGILCSLYFGFVYDTSVSTTFGQFNNMGLMQDRQLGLIVGIAASISGIIIMAARRG